MWKRFKNWLIKRLGGYTKAEYDDWSRFHIQRQIVRDVRRTVDLRVAKTVRCEEFMALGKTQTELLVRRELTDALTKAAQPYIVWRQVELPTEFLEMHVEAMLTVADNR